MKTGTSVLAMQPPSAGKREFMYPKHSYSWMILTGKFVENAVSIRRISVRLKLLSDGG